ncbi:hypothetical protein GP486_000665 [Trichoglossum hirsutum]|uniref:MSP domain-containing protein n=1 Tax=Trichoglossum hirsutum TaxID=265104 RepID=A0A9P8LIM2_9PEZI|nr:hypothetical protein GP486_000665 [Trichoglossum hirsutum]
MKEDPPLDAKCRDKFLVQSVAVTADKEFSNVPSIVRSLPKPPHTPCANGSGSGSMWTRPPNPRLKKRKSRLFSCLRKAKLHISEQPQPPAYRSATPDAVTPHHSIPSIPTGTTSRQESHPSDSTDPVEATSSAFDDKTLTSNDNVQGLRNQLEKAHAEITRLLKEKSEQGLRQRKTDAVNQGAQERVTTETADLGVQQQSVEGVPVQVVAALCLLSFLLAYLFF